MGVLLTDASLFLQKIQLLEPLLNMKSQSLPNINFVSWRRH